MQRRGILKCAGGALALAGLHTGAAWADEGIKERVSDSANDNPFAWSRASTERLVGQAFWLQHPQAGVLSLTLASLDLPAKQRADPRLEQFSLVFQAPLQPAVAGDTYALDHPALGRFALFLAPAGRSGGMRLYRSDFSLLRLAD